MTSVGFRGGSQWTPHSARVVRTRTTGTIGWHRYSTTVITIKHTLPHTHKCIRYKYILYVCTYAHDIQTRVADVYLCHDTLRSLTLFSQPCRRLLTLSWEVSSTRSHLCILQNETKIKEVSRISNTKQGYTNLNWWLRRIVSCLCWMVGGGGDDYRTPTRYGYHCWSPCQKHVWWELLKEFQYCFLRKN